MTQYFVDKAPATQLTQPVTTNPLPGTIETWYVATPAGYPEVPFEFGIDLTTQPEWLLCTNISNVTPTSSEWTVQRGFDNSSTSTHSISAGQIVAITSAITPTQGNAHLAAFTNLVQDPTFAAAQNGTGTWTLVGGTYGTANGDLSVSGNSWFYYGTGSPASFPYPKSRAIPVVAGVTYEISCYIDATNVTVGAPIFAIADTGVTTTYVQLSQPAGQVGTLSATWTCPTGVADVVVILDVDNATVNAGATVSWSSPTIVRAVAIDSLGNPMHPQYFDAANSRHGTLNQPDGSLTHEIEGSPLVTQFSIATKNYLAVPASHWGDVAYAGNSVNPANSLHVHGRESIEELQSGLWPPGTLALYGVQGTPPGWMECKGYDVRVDLAPQLYDQYGYAFGSAIDWYPGTPVFPSYVGYDTQTITDPYNQAEITVNAPYTYMLDPRNVVLYLPEGSNTYLKLPNIGQLPSVPAGAKWIVKVDYGYTWAPRPPAPPAQTLYVAPYAVDSSYPQAVAQDNGGNSPDILVKTPITVERSASTGFKWAYDAIMGIPVIIGADYISPGTFITGPFLVPVLPQGAPIPNGMTLLPSTTPAPGNTETIVISEKTVQLKSIRMTVTNGFGFILTSDNWLNLAGAPFLNASDPTVDGYYITGEVNAQQRNGLILIVVSNVNTNSWNANGSVGPAVPMTSDNLAVFYPVYT